MTGAARGPRSTARLFAAYAAISLVPVLVLGIVLAISVRSEADSRGLAEGRSEARLIAQTAVEPLLVGTDLRGGLQPKERDGLRRLVSTAVARKSILRVRVRDLNGRVRFSDDGSGFAAKPEDEALDAAAGRIVARLTRLNSDSNDTGHQGVESVEVYIPLEAGGPRRLVGVLELYLPYAPIGRDVTAGLHGLYVDLALGLALLYLALFLIAASVGRGLRREAAVNAFLAQHDTLTALPNRTLFHRRAEQAVAVMGETGRSVTLAIVDLDRFKDVNDTLGHDNGDYLLTELARRLAANMRPGDTVARLGGDEFGLLVCDVGDPEPILGRLREVIDLEVEVCGLPLSVQASIGYVSAPEDGTDVGDLMQRADVAMYVAKAQHAGVTRYDPSFDHYDASSLSLVSQLRRAIDESQLVLHYQPQTKLDGAHVHGVEALVRWQHPDHGLLSPDRFLPLAEQTDVIDRLTWWVLQTALEEVRTLDPVAGELRVAVNVSARSIGRRSFAGHVLRILEEVRVSPTRLTIEVTETALVVDPEAASRSLGQLADAGVSLSLDDFGRGQTSLGYLSALPIHELKIDKGFVLNMLENPAHAAIVRSIIDLGHNLGLRVVAEGVETQEVLARLEGSGCDIAQGFLLARPMPLGEIAQWLDAADPSRAAA